MRKIPITLLWIALLMAALPFAWAEALRTVDLTDGPQVIEIAPDADATYDLCAFPGEGSDGGIHAELYRGDILLNEATGSLTLMSVPLEAGETYTLRLTGTGRALFECARHALSRCFDDPKPLNPEGDAYEKAVVKPGDAHWYAVTAEESQPLALSGLPEDDGLRLEARLFSEGGRLLAEATRTAGGAILMDFMPRAGRTYRVRVSGEGTGLYELNLTPGAGGLPEALMLSEDSLTLRGREIHKLDATPIPAGAAGAMLWESSDAGVVTVTQDGTLTGRRPGTAVVTAYAAGAVRARCRVEVQRVAAEGVRLITSRIHMNVGDDAALEWTILPENASDPRVSFEIEPGDVAQIDAGGVLRALKTGSATITLRSADGAFTATGSLFVAPARVRRRALLIGEQHYAPDVATPRTGSANSVAGIRSMLNELSFSGARYEISTGLDVSRDALLEAIERAFDGATDQDEGLFYITCHGYYAHGMTVFQLYDGTELTALALRQALDRVPGRITLLLDCCGSGGVTGQPGDILDGVTRAFEPVAPVFASSKYRVLASAMVDQDSYRLSFDATSQETRMATLFARAVCEGCGWSIDAAARRAMRADVNYDNRVSLDELYNYARRRVMWYLGLTHSGYAQTVQVAPEGSVGALFERTWAGE